MLAKYTFGFQYQAYDDGGTLVSRPTRFSVGGAKCKRSLRRAMRKYFWHVFGWRVPKENLRRMIRVAEQRHAWIQQHSQEIMDAFIERYQEKSVCTECGAAIDAGMSMCRKCYSHAVGMPEYA